MTFLRLKESQSLPCRHSCEAPRTAGLVVVVGGRMGSVDYELRSSRKGVGRCALVPVKGAVQSASRRVIFVTVISTGQSQEREATRQRSGAGEARCGLRPIHRSTGTVPLQGGEREGSWRPFHGDRRGETVVPSDVNTACQAAPC